MFDEDPYAMLQQMGMSQPQGMFGADPRKKKKGGFNPLMLLSPMGGLMAQDPKLGMSLMSPAFGLANLFGAFK